MFNCTKHVTKIISCLFTGLVLLTGDVHAQTELGPAPAQSRPSPSYQPGADYQSSSSGPRKETADKIERVKRQEQNLRGMMASFGVTELDVQNSIIVYLQDYVLRIRPLREQGRRLYRALQNETISTTEMAGLLTDFRAAIEADTARRAAAEAALSEQTGYTNNPRLEAMLLLLGVIGDGPAIMNIPVPHSTPAPTNNSTAPRTIPAGINNGTAQPTPDDAAEPPLGFSEAQRLALLEHFDFNRDGELDPAERNEARETLAREFLQLGLWPSALKKKTVASNNGTPAGNSGATGNSDAGGRSTPGDPPVTRIPGPLPVIPAVSPSNTQPAN